MKIVIIYTKRDTCLILSLNTQKIKSSLKIEPSSNNQAGLKQLSQAWTIKPGSKNQVRLKKSRVSNFMVVIQNFKDLHIPTIYSTSNHPICHIKSGLLTVLFAYYEGGKQVTNFSAYNVKFCNTIDDQDINEI